MEKVFEACWKVQFDTKFTGLVLHLTNSSLTKMHLSYRWKYSIVMIQNKWEIQAEPRHESTPKWCWFILGPVKQHIFPAIYCVIIEQWNKNNSLENQNFAIYPNKQNHFCSQQDYLRTQCPMFVWFYYVSPSWVSGVEWKCKMFF